MLKKLLMNAWNFYVGRKLTYYYFVSYSWRKGFGNAHLHMSFKVKGYFDIQQMKKVILRENKDLGVDDVVILYWTYLGRGY